jgi:prepilin-type N-terminal cleavage/methylation domain-containing protein
MKLSSARETGSGRRRGRINAELRRGVGSGARLPGLRRAWDSAPYHTRRGFTLIELLLTLVVLMLLLGAMVINFATLQGSSQLDEGVEQFESLVRYARAHAANSGCRVRLAFEEAVGDEQAAVPLGNVFVMWEPDPLNKPGEFHSLAEVQALLDTMLQLVEVDEVRPVRNGLPELAPPNDPLGVAEEQSYGFEPITFYPDGSSDTAEVIFSARESEEERHIAVQIIGATGAVRRYAVEALAVEGGASEK